ncbi:MAG: hypothetical protein HYZ54_02620 [Ignavibacteriae bacterium]|nr:hypothetical protein [Ignavibacteriota bacterium]
MKTIITARGLVLSIVLIVSCMVIFVSTKAKEALDGKTFVGELIDNGKRADNCTMSFKNGKFVSKECVKYGFYGGTYTTTTGAGSGIKFEITETSKKEGTMKWQGTVTGTTIEGTCLWTKTGQKDILYTFKGTLKK